MQDKVIALQGDRIGMLVVQGITPGEPAKRRCVCDCGNVVDIRSGELNRDKREMLSGKAKMISCGCLKRNMHKELVGGKFGHLDVIDWRYTEKGANEVLVKCDCGTSEPFWKNGGDVKRGRVKVCRGIKCQYSKFKDRGMGKAKKGEVSLREKHGWLVTRYNSMHERCYYTKHHSYKNYGMKGIGICDEWNKDETKDAILNYIKWFLAELKKDYIKDVVDPSVDRIDPDKGYCPNNCRLASKSVQSANQKPNVFRKYDLPRHVSQRETVNEGTKYSINLEFEAKLYRTFNMPSIAEAVVQLHVTALKYKLVHNTFSNYDFEVVLCSVSETNKNILYTIADLEPVISPRTKDTSNVYYKSELRRVIKNPIGERTIKWRKHNNQDVENQNEWVYGNISFPIELAQQAIIDINN